MQVQVPRSGHSSVQGVSGDLVSEVSKSAKQTFVLNL